MIFPEWTMRIKIEFLPFLRQSKLLTKNSFNSIQKHITVLQNVQFL